MELAPIEARKARAKAWFEALRDDICGAFEELERDIQNSHEQDVVPATPATPAAPATQSQ